MKKIIMAIAKFAYFFTGFFLMMSTYSYAYFDPSATTYVIQAVGALIVAAGALLTVFRHKIFKFFKGNKEEDKKEEIVVEEED